MIRTDNAATTKKMAKAKGDPFVRELSHTRVPLSDDPLTEFLCKRSIRPISYRKRRALQYNVRRMPISYDIEILLKWFCEYGLSALARLTNREK
jgi:hypothetical protein